MAVIGSKKTFVDEFGQSLLCIDPIELATTLKQERRRLGRKELTISLVFKMCF
jgi:hypothetical protein